MVRLAYAKVNLCLEVLGRRADGLHEIATIMQTVSLSDRLRFVRSDELSLQCQGMEVAPDNLILQAARLLRQCTGARHGCAVVCHKRIPVGAGLGGGSADAAATLLALNQLWGTGLGAADLGTIAGQLGADVPFFLRGGTLLATGTGRTLEPLPPAPNHWVVLLPRGSSAADKTASMYGRLQPGDFRDGSMTDAQRLALQAGHLDYGAIQSSFWRVAAERWPELEEVRKRLEAAGALAATVAGSGPSTFGLFSSRRTAVSALAQFRAGGFTARLARFVEAQRPDFTTGASSER